MTTVPAKAMICPALIGRDGALRTVVDALAAERGPPVVRVFGEAGIGKSRLVAEALRMLPDRRPLRRASSFEADRLLPLGLFLELLGDARVPGGAHLASRIAEHARSDAEAPVAARELARRQLFDELAATLLDDDALLVCEDLHWTDEASLDALAHVVRRAGARPRLLVTYRDDEVGAGLAGLLATLDRTRLAVDVPSSSSRPTPKPSPSNRRPSTPSCAGTACSS